MNNSELIQRVKSQYNKGVASDDSRLTSRHIYNKLLSVRSRLLFQKVNKNQKINQWSYQTIPCIELIEAPIHECPCVPIGCKILRSKYKLPKTLSGLSRHIIQSVTTLDGQENISESSFELEKYRKGNKYTPTKPHYYIRNEYLYITNMRSLEVITLTGLFDNPLEVYNFQGFCPELNCPDCDCISYLDLEFPIDPELEDPIIELSLKELVEFFSQMREDQTNDARDNNIQESKS